MSTSEKENPVQLTWYGRVGEWLKKNQGDIALVAGFVLVAVISFGLGYLTAPSQEKQPLIIEGPSVQSAINEQGISDKIGEAAINQSLSSEKGIIVASKNSKIYHWPWCAPARQIKPENQIWFKSETEAQASGRTRCADFEKLAPAGYPK